MVNLRLHYAQDAQASKGMARIADDLLHHLGVPASDRRKVECHHVSQQVPYLVCRLYQLGPLGGAGLPEPLHLGVPQALQEVT
jgi:hypothetical protein